MSGQGVRLQLFIGPNVPILAPYPIMEALTNLEVTNRDDNLDGFQMNFTLGKNSSGEYGLLRVQSFAPRTRVFVAVLIGSQMEVLIDGVITHHQFQPTNRPGESTLAVTGLDTSAMMSLEDRNRPHSNQSDSTIVTNILQSYSQYGLRPQVTPTNVVHSETNLVRNQQTHDLAYIQLLARRNGFVFYVEPANVPNQSRAYWGPKRLPGPPQPALSMNRGPWTNVDAPIDFQFDALEPEESEVGITETGSRQAIPVATPGNQQPPLARQAFMPIRKTIARDSAKLSSELAALRAGSTSTRTSDAITATGEINTARYGHVLRARRLVSVAGVGDGYNGDYYVQSITHQIRRGEYKQRFTLKRSGHGATGPRGVA